MKIWIYCITSILIWSCSSISKPDEPGLTNEIGLPETIFILKEQMERIGSSVDSTSIEQTFNLPEYKATIDCYGKVEKEIHTAIDLVLKFESDSICKKTFEDITKHMDNSWYVSKGSNTFRSWEYPSQRNFVTVCMLDNKSSFYNVPTLEIMLIENDDRYYRK